MSFVNFSGDTSVLFGIAPAAEILPKIENLEAEIASIRDPRIREQSIALIRKIRQMGGPVTRRIPEGSHTYFVCIDSRDRNTTAYPNLDRYKITLPYCYRQVFAFRLARGFIKRDGVISDRYAFLRIKNIPSRMSATAAGGHDAFCHILLNNSNNRITESSFDKSMFFEFPIDRLMHLDIEWVRNDGTVYTMSNHMLLFQIHCMSVSAIT